MTRWQRDVLVEARADAILDGGRTAEAYGEHFDAQLRAVRSRAWSYRGLTALLGAWRPTRPRRGKHR